MNLGHRVRRLEQQIGVDADFIQVRLADGSEEVFRGRGLVLALLRASQSKDRMPADIERLLKRLRGGAVVLRESGGSHLCQLALAIHGSPMADDEPKPQLVM